MRACNELERRRPRDRVDREPDRARLRPVDVVVRLILVPRRALRRPRLFHEHVVVVEPHLVGSHQLARDRGRRRVRRDTLDLAQPLPVAEVLEEAARIVRPARDEGALARLGEIERRSPPRRARDPRPRTLPGRRPHRRAGTPRQAPDRHEALLPSRESTSIESSHERSPRPLGHLALRRGRRARPLLVRSGRAAERGSCRGAAGRSRRRQGTSLSRRHGGRHRGRAHDAPARRHDRARRGLLLRAQAAVRPHRALGRRGGRVRPDGSTAREVPI